MKRLNDYFAEYQGKLRISDIRTAPEEIVSFVIKNRLMICEQGRLYLNCGTHWELCKSVDIPDILCSLLLPEQAAKIPTRAIDEASKRLMRHPSLRVNMELEREKNKHLVNVKNGVYNIIDGSFTEQRGDAIFDYMLNFSYEHEAKIELARNFMAFVNSSLGRVYLPCLLRILAYCVSSLTKARKAFLLLGKGATGKSTVLEFIESIAGEDHCSHVPFHNIGSQQSRAEYIGKRLNISRDNSDQPMRREDAFKSLVSNEMLTGRRLYENAVDFVPRLKLIFASNVDLHFSHPDDAVYDRLLVIPFNKEVPKDKRDIGLLQKLLDERDTILSVALNYLPDLVKNGYDFGEPDACKHIIERYCAALHTAESFMEECCIVDETGTVSSVLLYRHYSTWCCENGFDPEGQRTFYSHVRSFDPSIRDGKVNHGGSRVNGFRGIMLKDAEDAQATDKKPQ